MFDLGAPPPRRRPGLTPMIDVIFLLVVFFMLAARFGAEGAQPLALAGGVGAWQGPPRLVEVRPEGVALNGVALDPADLTAALAPLVAGPDDPVLLRAAGGAGLQRVVDVLQALAASGHRRLVLVE